MGVRRFALCFTALKDSFQKLRYSSKRSMEIWGLFSRPMCSVVRGLRRCSLGPMQGLTGNGLRLQIYRTVGYANDGLQTSWRSSTPSALVASFGNRLQVSHRHIEQVKVDAK